MTINDRIYGEIKIKDQIIIDLINTPIFQRLKNISQDGAAHFIQPVRNVTRYEHSIGVYYLSCKYQKSMEERVASLLHDLSHTAFSHVIDFVMGDKKHEYADKKLNEMIINSPIPEIISSYGFDLKKVLNKENYLILDNSLPDISIDRLDYFLRDGYMMGFLPIFLINEFIKNLEEKDNTLFFRDKRLASTFAILFMNFSRLIWLDPSSHGSYFLLSNALKISLEKGEISENDFFSDENTLFTKLLTSKNNQVKGLLARLKENKEFVYAEKSQAEFFGPNKPRFVNPLVMVDDKLERVSKLVPNLTYYFEEFMQKYKVIGVNQLDS